MLGRRTLLGTALAAGGAAAAGLTVPAWAAPHRGPTRPAREVGDGIPAEDRAEGAVVFSTSFEDAEETWYLNDQTSRSTTSPVTGSYVMHVHRTDPTVYLTSQTVLPYVSGTEYVLTAQLRAENLSRTDSRDGARMALEAYDANGRWIYGRYGASIQDAEWVEQVITFAPTAIVTELRLTLFLGKDVSGDAWFDDVVVREKAPPPFATALVTPSHRGLLVPGDHDEVRLVTRPGLRPEALPRYRVRVTLADATGTVVARDEVAADTELVFTHPADELAPGSHVVRAELLDDTGAVVAEDAWPVEKLGPDDTVPQRWIDRHGRLRHGETVHFPLGFYSSGVQESHLQLLQGSSFNCLLPYGEPRLEWLDLAQQYGIDVVGSLKDIFHGEPYAPDELTSEDDEVPYLQDLVRRLKDHPAVLAWYIQDERDPDTYGDRLMAHHAGLVEVDPDHPAVAVDYRRPPAHIQMRATDAFGVDSYPVTGSDTNHLEQPAALASAAREALPHRMMWHVVQSFGWSAYPPAEGRPPTTDELRSMAWQYICHGATGLLFYSLHNMDDGVGGLPLEEVFARAEVVGAEIIARRGLILSVEPPPEVTATGGDGLVSWTVRRHDGRGHLVVVSADPHSAHEVTFTLPGATVLRSSTGRRLDAAADGTVSVTVEPLQVQWLEFPLRRR